MDPIPETPTRVPATAEGESVPAAEGGVGRSMPPPPLVIGATPPPNTPPSTPGTGAGPGTPAVCGPAPALTHRAPEHPRAGRQRITFLDLPVEVSQAMAQALRRVEDDLVAQYAALSCEERARYPTVRAWAKLDRIGGYDARRATGQHLTGDAVDCSYDNQPYIPTRNFVTPRGSTDGRRTEARYGGEHPPRGRPTDPDYRTDEEYTAYSRDIRALRAPAVEVMDRATVFMSRNPYDPSHAELHNRETTETITHAYHRFRDASDNLGNYMQLAFRTTYDSVHRAPIANAQTVGEEVLLRRIPETERYSEAEAIVRIQAWMADPFWRIVHGNETRTPREIFIQILRDYETVRVPLQRNRPSTSPADTRNPANGFLQLPLHFVRSMVEVGRLRWGACMFGSSASGDVHHFDTAAWIDQTTSTDLNHSDDDGL